MPARDRPRHPCAHHPHRAPRARRVLTPTAEAPAVTVAVLVYRPTAHEVATIDLIRAQHYDADVSIAAIDSSPEPDRPENAAIRESVDQWRVISPAEFGHGRTRNLAVDDCKTPLIVYLSQDAHPIGDGWLDALVRPLRDGTAVAAYGRQVAPPGQAERAATFSFLYPDEGEVKTKADVGRLGLRAFHFSDVSSAFVADALREVRFPEDLPTFEDVGVAKRLLDGGHAVAYVPEARVAHGDPMAAGRLFRRYRQIGAIYEKLGIFSELRAAGAGVTRTGVRTAGAVTAADEGRVRRLFTAAVKALAVTCGRAEWKLGRHLPPP